MACDDMSDDGRFDDADEDEGSDVFSDGLPEEEEEPEFDDVFETALREGWVTEAEYDRLTDAIASGERTEEDILEEYLPKLEPLMQDHVMEAGALSAASPLQAGGLFGEQLKLLPFLVRAHGAKEGGLEEYHHPLPTPRAPLVLAQFPEGVGCASEAGRPAWGWRVWDSSKALARLLAARPEGLEGKTVLELGAGAGLASLVAARLGAGGVCATDLARALPLLRHNLTHDGARASVGGEAAKAPVGHAVCCPVGHALDQEVTSHEDYICNVCGLEDPLGGGIEIGEAVHTCRKCDFDVCGRCVSAAEAGEWQELPGWFKLQCEGPNEEASVWTWPEKDGAPARSPSTFVCHPFDLLAPNDLSGMRTATAALLDGLPALGLPQPPTLVLLADVSCSASLVTPMAMVLRVLGELLPAGSEALLIHERREPAVDAALLVALREYELRYEELDLLPAADPDAGDAAPAALQAFKVQL